MTDHALIGSTAAERIAAEVRAEMARQRRTASELAQAVGISAHTAGRRLNGAIPFSIPEMDAVARWLGVDIITLLERTERLDRAVAS